MHAEFQLEKGKCRLEDVDIKFVLWRIRVCESGSALE